MQEKLEEFGVDVTALIETAIVVEESEDEETP